MPFSLFIALLLTVGTTQIMAGTTYYVSTEGENSNPGTKSEPWETIQHAIDSLRPGDTATVLPGTYREKLEFNNSGKKDAPITLQAEGTATISGKRMIGDHLITIANRNYIHVIGFELTDHLDVNDGSGIRVEGECAGIELRNNKIHNIRGQHAMGITVYGTSVAAPIKDIVIDNNEIYDCDPAKSEALVLNGNIDGFKVTNNHVHDVNNIGIDFIGGEKSICKDVTKVARNGICSGNRVERALSSYGGGYAAGIYVDGGKDIIIEKNIVTGCDMGIEIGAENKHATTTGIIVRNNHLYLNDKAGIVFGGYSKKVGTVTDCKFENNICYKNTSHKKANGELWIQGAAGNTISNNIFYGTKKKPIVLAEKFAGENQLSGNTYYSDDKDNVEFGWRGKYFNTYSKFAAAIPQGEGAAFKAPNFPDPDNGKFE